MALTSIDIKMVNNPIKGCIEIVSTKRAGASNRIVYMLISRKKHSDSYYERMYEKQIGSVNDLSFTDIDITSRSGYMYDYYIELTDGNSAGYNIYEFGEVIGIECWFDGLFIGNEEVQYLAPLNCNTSTVRNTQASYVTTLASRTPYRVANSSVNYTTGQTSALFIPLDVDNQPVVQTTKEYLESVVDFLLDGTEKILKTHDGEAWLVSIDPTINIAADDKYIGSSTISFNWTETGDLPSIKKVDNV